MSFFQLLFVLKAEMIYEDKVGKRPRKKVSSESGGILKTKIGLRISSD